MTTKNKLPTKLSALLRVAVGDAKKCARDPRYTLVMATWHDPNYGNRGSCSVCMAGAVMAQRLGTKPYDMAVPAHTEHGLALNAIDMMRDGDFDGAATNLLPPSHTHDDDILDKAAAVVMKTYRNNRDGGRAQWSSNLAAARILEGAGL